MSILDYIPEGFSARPLQVKILELVEKNWNHYRVFVLPLAVGSGKSLVATTIAKWQADQNKTTALITPQVMLQDQYEAAFENLPSLKGKSRYTCKSKIADHCGDHHDYTGNYCEKCPFVAARIACKKSHYAVYNFHTYMYTKHFRDNLIIDEAQNTADIMSDMYTLKIWRHQSDYGSINSYGDLAVWLEAEIDMLSDELDSMPTVKGDHDHNREVARLKRRQSRYKLVLEGLVKSPTNFLIENRREMFRGVDSDVLAVRPINLKYIPHGLWTVKTNKIILLSATIGEQDIEDLGLAKQAVFYATPESPIPPEQRPVVFKPIAPMTYQHRQASLPKIAKAIGELAERHNMDKGVIHTTYQVAAQLKRLIKDPRFMWHNQDNKDKTYHEFLEKTDNSILVASGMSEGIDLMGDLATWQVITQIVWPNLSDALNMKKKQDRPEWFLYQAVLDLMQRTGRVCRGPEDYGVTYLLDSSSRRVISQARKAGLLPRYFIDSLKVEE